jgi:hypothetical protein
VPSFKRRLADEPGTALAAWPVGRISCAPPVSRSYSTYYKNWAVSRTGGITPGFTYNVFDLIRDSYIKGWDVSIAARPLPTWQLMLNYAKQDPRIQVTNTRLPSSFRGSWGVFSSYQFFNRSVVFLYFIWTTPK